MWGDEMLGCNDERGGRVHWGTAVRGCWCAGGLYVVVVGAVEGGRETTGVLGEVGCWGAGDHQRAALPWRRIRYASKQHTKSPLFVVF